MVKASGSKVVWDRIALDNFKEILEYLAKHSSQAPKIVKDAIIARLEVIKTNPKITELDKLKDEPNKDFRAFIVYNYRVTYQIKTDLKEIWILRIIHTSREPLGY